jgi:ERCC4-type nuclease
MTASVKSLEEVEGIGPKTARSIRWAVEEASVRYAPSLAQDPD